MAPTNLQNYKLDDQNNKHLNILEKYGEDLLTIIDMVSPKSNHIIRTIVHNEYWNKTWHFLKTQEQDN